VAESVGLMAAYCYILERINIKSCEHARGMQSPRQGLDRGMQNIRQVFDRGMENLRQGLDRGMQNIRQVFDRGMEADLTYLKEIVKN
jgi:hypothetical protein